MSLAKFNKTGGVHFDVDTEGMEGKKASEIYKEIKDHPLIMKAIFINKDSGYGESVSVVTNNSLIYFSKVSLELARSVREDADAVKEINSKGAAFQITEFESKKYNKKCYTIRFLEDDETPDYIKQYLETGEVPSDIPESDPIFKY